MTIAKRLMDIILALLLAAVLAVPFSALLIWLKWRERGPLFYVSERMKGVDAPFDLWKLRTMSVVKDEDNTGVSGGDKASRVTPLGARLRRYRLDEVPQLWNVLRGDMSFVGPRPPLRIYVERFPTLYAEVLRSRPGITGLATLVYHRHEERLLAACTSPEETDRVYSERCVPRKADLDLIYQARRTVCYDIRLMWQTAARVFSKRR